MSDCAKYQHHIKNFSIFLNKHKIAFCTFFEGLKKLGPIRKHKKKKFYVLDLR